jgi:hypothetical protein
VKCCKLGIHSTLELSLLSMETGLEKSAEDIIRQMDDREVVSVPPASSAPPTGVETTPAKHRRKGHKKSRYGCLNCKRRRVKVKTTLYYATLLELIVAVLRKSPRLQCLHKPAASLCVSSGCKSCRYSPQNSSVSEQCDSTPVDTDCVR